jgi:hypothetical protein
MADDAGDEDQVAGPPSGSPAPLSRDEFMRQAGPNGAAATAGAPASSDASAVPGPMSRDDFMRQAGPANPTAQAYFDQTADAASVGLGRRAVAAGDALFQREPGDAASFGDRYSQHLSDEDARLAAERTQHPVASALGNVTGAVTSPIGAGIGKLAAGRVPGAGVLAGLARGAAAGGAVGGAYGAGQSDWSNPKALAEQTGLGIAGGAAAGAALGTAGALLGKVAPAIGSVGSKIARLVGLGGSDAADASAGDAASGMSGAQGAAPVPAGPVGQMSSSAARVLVGAQQQATPDALAAANAPGGIVADAFPGLARFARGASDETRTGLDAAYAARDATRLDRLTEPLEDAVGVQRGNLSQTIDGLVAQQKATADQLYPQAYFNGDGTLRTVSSPEINAIIDENPEFQKAWPVARRLVKDEHGVDIGDVPTTTAVPGLTSAQVQSLRANNYTPEMIQRLAQHAGPPAPAQPIPVIGLQYLKEGVDDVVANGMGKDGRIGPRIAQLLSGKLAQMRTLADAQNSEWGVARAAFSGDAQAQEAAAQGARDVLNPQTTGYDMQSHLGALQPSDQALYKQTALDQVLQHAENADWTTQGATDPVRQILNGLGGPQKFRALAATPEKYQEFMDALQPIIGQRALQKFVTAGSQTADKAQMAAFYNELAAPSLNGSAISSSSGSLNPADVIGMIKSPMRTVLTKGLAAVSNRAASQDAATAAAQDAAVQTQRAATAREVGSLLSRPGAQLSPILQAAQARAATDAAVSAQAQSAAATSAATTAATRSARGSAALQAVIRAAASRPQGQLTSGAP